MMPLTATPEDVMSVAHTMTASRSFLTLIPMDSASSSVSVRRFIFHRMRKSGITPRAKGMISIGSEDGTTEDREPISQNVMAGSFVYGSPTYFIREMPAANRADITMPVRTNASRLSESRPPRRLAKRYVPPTASKPKTKAMSCTPKALKSSSKASAAPKPAPLVAPRMSGDTIGLRKFIW